MSIRFHMKTAIVGQEGEDIMSRNTISLCELHGGERGAIVRLEQGSGCLGRLAALGFTPGASVAVMRNPSHGPLIVAILDTEIALGRGQARQVQVLRLD